MSEPLIPGSEIQQPAEIFVPSSDERAGPGSGNPDSAAESTGNALAHGQGHYHSQVTRALVLIAAAGCFALFWWVGRWLSIPFYSRYEASLMQQPGGGKILALFAAIGLFVTCTLLGHLTAGRRWLYAGPFAACCGLAAWSLRGGPSRYVYFRAAQAGDGRSIFLLLALELAVLSLFIGMIWFVVADGAREVTEGKAGPPPLRLTPRRLQSLGIQLIITVIAIMILAPVDDKKEALAAVFVGSFIGAAVTEMNWGKDNLFGWYWVAPALAGILGYLVNFMTNAADAPTVTGQLFGFFAPLARPLPLDYASLGTAGALLGFWATGEHAYTTIGMSLFAPPRVRRSLTRVLLEQGKGREI